MSGQAAHEHVWRQIVVGILRAVARTALAASSDYCPVVRAADIVRCDQSLLQLALRARHALFGAQRLVGVADLRAEPQLAAAPRRAEADAVAVAYVGLEREVAAERVERAEEE